MATTQLQLRRGTAAQNDAFTGAEGEVTVDLTNKCLRLHDNATQGGMIIPKKSDVVSATGNINQSINGQKTFANVLTAQDGGINITRSVFTKGTAPSETMYWGIRANDKTNSTTWGNTRIGTLEWTITSANVVTGTFNAIKNEAGSTTNSGIAVAYDTANNKGWATAPKPENDEGTTNNRIVTTGWANDSTAGVNNLVHKSGTETISGQKTFSTKIYANGGVQGTASSALWADLAEQYIPDEKYPIGTLIKFGGEKDITIADTECNGIISEQPGFLLDCGLKDSLPVALTGKTRVRVIGKVNKFDKLVLSKTPGIAKVKESEDEKVIGIALASSEEKEEKLVMSVVKIEF